ncbi:MAG: hypothetical protein RLZZ227_2580 [Pseudomonadota bacterium]
MHKDIVARLLLLTLLSAPVAVTAQDIAAPAPAESQPEVDASGAEEEEEFFVFDESETSDSASAAIADPLEGMNRAIFSFNDKAYRGVLKPIARGLRVIPEPVRVGGRNFFTNLGAPVSSVSALLQGDVRNFGTEFGRFVLNTTAGLGGFLDVATDVGLVQDEEDIGQTLGRYGVGHGFYLVLPLIGSSSLRETVGMIGTGVLNPVYDNLNADEIAAARITEAELALSLDRDTYESLYDSSLDPYTFFRSAWTQNRAGRVAQ